MKPELLVDLEDLIQYVWEDEEKNWEEAGRPEKHIFITIKRLNDYLADGTKGTDR